MADSADAAVMEVAAQIHQQWAPSAGARALARLEAHEEVCALRYQGIIDRVGRLEKVIIGAAGTLILGMGGLIATLVLHH